MNVAVLAGKWATALLRGSLDKREKTHSNKSVPLFQHGIGKQGEWPVSTSNRLVVYNQHARERRGRRVQWQDRSFPRFL